LPIDEIWKLYKSTGDKDYKNQLIINYVKLVKIVSGRLYNFYGGNVEYDDLLGYGVLGLIDAIEKFDISRELKFETYAQIRIRGSIIDSLRKIDWVPRGLRKKYKEIESAISKLENKFGRSANIKDISAETNMSIEDIESTLSEMSILSMVSIEDMLNSKGDIRLSGDYYECPDAIFEDKEIKQLLTQSIDELNEKEKLVVSLYYFNELTYKEIGKILDLSESRISQIHTKAIISIKNSLNKRGINGY